MNLQTRMATRVGLLALLVTALGFTPAFAQGTQTGVLSGVVESTDGAPLPGVTVSISSPALQGERTAVTDTAGAYILRGLPPGEYRVRFSLAGFGDVERTVQLALGDVRPLNASLGVATVQETVEVTAAAPSILENTQVQANYRAETVDKLAMNRNLSAFAELAPGTTDNGPNTGQIVIAGAFAYDNVFLLNGVDINDNLFGTANNLFIEDAIQEVQVLTSGISAEYGRFSGGVVNAVTKSGGNTFFGSYRADFTNPSWRDESRFVKEGIAANRPGIRPNRDDTSRIHMATLGGPIVKDRLWFFGAARREGSVESRNLTIIGTSYDYQLDNNRYEGKLTGAISPNHNVQATYIRNTTAEFDRASINTSLSIDEHTLVDRTLPNDLFVANYNGVLTSQLFLEAQYSQKKFGFRGTGGTSQTITDSPFLALGLSGGIPGFSHYNAPYFSSFDPENRDNRQYSAALSYFLSTGNAGRHDLKFGFENYTSSRTGGNSQSATGYVFRADPIAQGGQPIRDGQGRMVPNFVPGVSRIENWISLQGAEINIQTLSFYVNDRWALNDRWSFNLGLRYAGHSTDATQAEVASISSSALVPRLGATFDVKGDGRWILQATYAHYAGKAAETQFADNSNVGTPNLLLYQYRPDAPAGQGIGFAPGFDLNNYNVIGGNFPTSNVFLADDLNTPVTREWTLQAGTRLGQRGELKLIYTDRSTTDFIEDFITMDTGTTVVTRDGRNFGTFDNVEVRNTDIPFREYRAMQLVLNHRPIEWFSVFGHYTLQLRNHGNFEGEAANQPGISSIIEDRPEFYNEARHYPSGRLQNSQRHKARVFGNFDIGLGRLGTASLGALYRYDSPQRFSFSAPNVALTPQQRALDPGYARPPTTQTLFFGERGAGEYESSHLFDLALNYEVPIVKSWRPWLKVEMRNVFNKQPLVGYNTTVTADANSPRDALGLPTGYTRGSAFGTATADWDANFAHLPRPREFRFSLGFRF
ncbi:MAG TPA: TonB-dependent receptor [Vicinamibacteria bacterium]|nr:TonB-dependent receptor [Vicinamibacteria bacterium]